jgi:S-adenosylmethionine:tRNA ribosyltransferase-isomerase
MGYSLKEFKISIPDELIAQFPSQQRHGSRLLILDASDGSIRDDHFYNITSLLTSKDCVVFNDARVINARLHGNKLLPGGERGGCVEILLTRRHDARNWQGLIRPARRVREGSRIVLENGTTMTVLQNLGEGVFSIRFSRGINYKDLIDIGEIPLPKYIKRKPVKNIDEDRYQTVYSRRYGAVASPTAGLHFTDALIQQLRERGILFVPITLHVDWGTFKPVRESDYRRHEIHREQVEISKTSAEAVNRARREGRRIICVGTTSVRALESTADRHGVVRSYQGETDLYIYPGYIFKTVDAMITNFHMPDSTLILLVAAFAGKEYIEKAYAHAVDKGYRFFSYGDAMFIHRSRT